MMSKFDEWVFIDLWNAIGYISFPLVRRLLDSIQNDTWFYSRTSTRGASKVSMIVSMGLKSCIAPHHSCLMCAIVFFTVRSDTCTPNALIILEWDCSSIQFSNLWISAESQPTFLICWKPLGHPTLLVQAISFIAQFLLWLKPSQSTPPKSYKSLIFLLCLCGMTTTFVHLLLYTVILAIYSKNWQPTSAPFSSHTTSSRTTLYSVIESVCSRSSIQRFSCYSLLPTG